jgi:hypothetical protein
LASDDGRAGVEGVHEGGRQLASLSGAAAQHLDEGSQVFTTEARGHSLAESP